MYMLHKTEYFESSGNRNKRRHFDIQTLEVTHLEINSLIIEFNYQCL